MKRAYTILVQRAAPCKLCKKPPATNVADGNGYRQVTHRDMWGGSIIPATRACSWKFLLQCNNDTMNENPRLFHCPEPCYQAGRLYHILWYKILLLGLPRGVRAGLWMQHTTHAPDTRQEPLSILSSDLWRPDQTTLPGVELLPTMYCTSIQHVIPKNLDFWFASDPD